MILLADERDFCFANRIVSIPAQTYFSNKACHVVQRPRILMFFLAILGLVSIATGTAASLALLIQSPQRTGEIALVSAAEGLFWSYLILITVSSLAISVPLVINFLRERRSLKNGINSKALAPAKPTKTTSSLRFLFSTYLMVFVIDFICFVSAVVSASPNFNAALHASQAFWFYKIYALIEGIPKSPSLNISAPYMDNGFGNQKDHTTSRLMGSLKNKPSKFFKNPDLREIHSSSVINLTKFNTHAHAPIPMEDEDEEEDNGGEEIFLYHYPSNVISPLGLESYSEDGANRVSKASSYGSLNKNYQLPAVGIPPSEKLPPIPKKPKYILPAMARKSSINSPPNLPTMPGKVHQINSNKKKDKHDRRVSTIKYISSNSSGTFQSCEL
ncbi:expressed protein [Phakopsora pachyrhizi]|uniref:Expressed protein n=1 Tax=Phakopsora pachyrhizi TaxID=170000 RepID=A0AAV0AS80_PHAPC|nr:expressed protein [Phakopsora pachyrhizi]